MTTKYAIVTGASPSSIGFLAAKKLASTVGGAFKVILACRNETKGKEAERLIQEADPSSQAVFVPLDLGLVCFHSRICRQDSCI